MTLSPELPPEESLTVEFKSDRKKLPDRELVETVVCLANADGGTIYLGVEDDGRPTGLHADHEQLAGLPAMIANRTSPPLVVTVQSLVIDGVSIARIDVPRSFQIIATSDGTTKRRRLNADGHPECVPLLPHEFQTRLSDLGALDATAQPVPGSTRDDLDPAERARLRQFVTRFKGDDALSHLSDEEMDGALGLVVRDGSTMTPSLAGLLLIGKEASIRTLVPTHELAFQVLEGEEVRLNEFSRAPLLRLFESVDALFRPLNPERDVQVGLFRVPVPRVDHRAFREAVANAVAHRDYTRGGAVHVRFDSDTLVVSNPGGFVEGVTQQNLLTTEPRPRNPCLADALKRIGVVERTGRGVDLIYRGLLRYGRPRPDYARSTPTSVVLRIPASGADLGFMRMVIDAEESRGEALPIDSLIALSCLKMERRISSGELAEAIQKDRSEAKATLERLVEAGLVEPHGRTRAQTYMLAAGVYTSLGQKVEYTRQVGFDAIQQEQMVLGLARDHGSVQRADVMVICRLSGDQASRLLKRLVNQGKLVASGKKRWTRYALPREGSE